MRVGYGLGLLWAVAAGATSLDVFIGDETWCDYPSLQAFLDAPPDLEPVTRLRLLLEPAAGGHKVHRFICSHFLEDGQVELELAGITGDRQAWEYALGREVEVVDYFHLDGRGLKALTVRNLWFHDLPELDMANPEAWRQTPIIAAEDANGHPHTIPTSWVTHCVFSGNHKHFALALSYSNLWGTPITVISHNLVAGNQGRSFLDDWLLHTGSFIYNNTFHANHYVKATLGLVTGMDIIANNLFTAHSLDGTTHHAIVSDEDGAEPPLMGRNITTDPNAPDATLLEEFRDPFMDESSGTTRLDPTQWQDSVGYVDIAGLNPAVRVGSICLDRGTRTLTSATFARFEEDFDETNPDIGCPLRLPVRQVVPGTTHLDMPAFYSVEQDVEVTATSLVIQPGTVIKLAAGVDFSLRSLDGVLRFGWPDRERIALVCGRGNERAHYVTLGDCAHPARAEFHGVLVNRAPELGVNLAGLRGVHLDWRTELDRQFRLMDFGGKSLQVSCGEEFEIDGLVVDPADPARPGRLAVVMSDVTLRQGEFHAGLEHPALHLVNASGSLLADNLFTTVGAHETPCVQLQGSVRYQRNRFERCRNSALQLLYAAAELGKGAANEFQAQPGWLDEPLVVAHSGSLDLSCGYNVFINNRVNGSSVDFLDWTGYPGRPLEWSKNFWGLATAQPILCSDLSPFLPSWVDAANCLAEAHPPVYFCPTTDDEAEELCGLGRKAEERQDPDLAVWYYSEVVRLHPLTKEAAYAADRLKVLGKRHETLAPMAIASLQAGGSLAAQAGDSWQSASQLCSALCVIARQVDWDAARISLDSLAASPDSLWAAVASLARAEIELDAPVGGLSAAGGAGWAARQQAALAALADPAVLAFHPPSGPAGPDRPSSLAIRSIRPNPANPVTWLELSSLQEGKAELRLFNLQGQLVQSLPLQLPAGTRMVRLDLSGLASGLYVVDVLGPMGSASAKFLLVR